MFAVAGNLQCSFLLNIIDSVVNHARCFLVKLGLRLKQVRQSRYALFVYGPAGIANARSSYFTEGCHVVSRAGANIPSQSAVF